MSYVCPLSFKENKRVLDMPCEHVHIGGFSDRPMTPIQQPLESARASHVEDTPIPDSLPARSGVQEIRSSMHLMLPVIILL